MLSIHYHMNSDKSIGKAERLEIDADVYMQFNTWRNYGNEKASSYYL